MARACRTCTHDDRERIEIALANSKAKVAGGVQRIADKYGIPRASLRRHMDHHMTQADFARLRLGMPDAIDASIEEVIRQEGEGAILLLRRMKGDHQAAVERWEKLGEFEQARKERIELRKVGEMLILYAGMVPGRKTVTNNNLVISDVAPLFDMIDAVLLPYPEARRAVAAALSHQPAPAAIEHRP